MVPNQTQQQTAAFSVSGRSSSLWRRPLLSSAFELLSHQLIRIARRVGKLPEAVLQRLTYYVADGLESQVPKKWLWCGRHVKIVDGSTVLAPD